MFAAFGKAESGDATLFEQGILFLATVLTLDKSRKSETVMTPGLPQILGYQKCPMLDGSPLHSLIPFFIHPLTPPAPVSLPNGW